MFEEENKRSFFSAFRGLVSVLYKGLSLRKGEKPRVFKLGFWAGTLTVSERQLGYTLNVFFIRLSNLFSFVLLL